jgi:AcrR family transcriptional regulator
LPLAVTEPRDRARAGRPRDPEVDEAILAATVTLLIEGGYARLTIDRVAAKAAVAKTSIYRRWPSKESLVLDAIRYSRSGERPAVPDTGRLRSDMLGYLRSLIRYRRAQSEALAAVASEVLANRGLAEVFRRHVLGGVAAGFRVIIERAIERGELAPATDVELLASLPLALIHQHRIATGETADEGLAKRIVDQFFSPASARRRGR